MTMGIYYALKLENSGGYPYLIFMGLRWDDVSLETVLDVQVLMMEQ